MLFELFFRLKDQFGPLNVFRYVSFRVFASLVTALLITLFLYPYFIRLLESREIGQVIQEDGPEGHFSKSGTPTMGGVLLVIAVVVSTLLWTDLTNPYVGMVLGITVFFGAVGFFDDYMTLKADSNAGLPGAARLAVEFAVTLIAMWALFSFEAFHYSTELFLPFVSTEKFKLTVPMWAYVGFTMLVIVGTANAVNLTDGLDGLAIGPVIIAAGTFLILSYSASTVLYYETVEGGAAVAHKFDLARYLMIPKVPGVKELAIFCASIIGAGVGFLWYNTFPAQVFMGDVGSLSLGAALGTMAVVTKHELLSTIILGLFLFEAVSVITQTVYYKLTGGRIFQMAPIHHHFEMKGWPEPKIIVRFWILAIFMNLIALASLKLR